MRVASLPVSAPGGIRKDELVACGGESRDDAQAGAGDELPTNAFELP